jgi:hypothetical protein
MQYYDKFKYGKYEYVYSTLHAYSHRPDGVHRIPY